MLFAFEFFVNNLKTFVLTLKKTFIFNSLRVCLIIDAGLRGSVEAVRNKASWGIAGESFTSDVRSAMEGLSHQSLKTLITPLPDLFNA